MDPRFNTTPRVAVFVAAMLLADTTVAQAQRPSATRHAELAAEPSSVSMDIDDKKFEAGLRSAKALNVVAAGATIQVPLDRSADAFDRLAECVEKNDKSVRTNPFVAPARRP